MSDLSVQIYHNKGLLEDLYTYMEKDPEINRDDYFGNVFDAIGIDANCHTSQMAWPYPQCCLTQVHLAILLNGH